MKNVKKFALVFAVLAASVLVATSCELPDYQLAFDINTLGITVDAGNNTVTVPYTLENIGSKDLSNVIIRIEVGVLGGEINDDWTWSVDLTSYSGSQSSTITIPFYTTDITATSDVQWAIVTGSAWDTTDDNSSIFD